MQYFQGSFIQGILNINTVSSKTVASVVKDCHLQMQNDWLRYNDDYLLGSDPDVDHIQIDESKFGKRKHNRGTRREGVWVFGLVEAVVDRENPGHFKKGRVFLCTVPNRTHHTLLPIIYSRCAPGTIIRSDGWAAYNSLHPEDVLLESGYRDNRTEYSRQGLHFRLHQVVNHSDNYATIDQVRGNYTVGLINTNLIEGVWTAVKRTIAPVYRTNRDCPGKLMEFLWRDQNKNNIYEGVKRMLKEVRFTAGTVEDEQDQLVTRGLDGNPPEVTAAIVSARARRDNLRMRFMIEQQNQRMTTEEVQRAIYEQFMSVAEVLGAGYTADDVRNAGFFVEDEDSDEDTDEDTGAESNEENEETNRALERVFIFSPTPHSPDTFSRSSISSPQPLVALPSPISRAGRPRRARSSGPGRPRRTRNN